MFNILGRRNKNNLILVGNGGVGKTAICRHLANLIVEKKAPVAYHKKKIVQMDISAMIAGANFRGMFEERLKGFLEEVKNDKNYIIFIDDIHNQFKFLDYAPILFISAQTGEGVDKILPAIAEAYDGFNRRIPTNVLNKIIMDAQDMNSTPDFNHGRLKILFANQVSIKPPTFVLFCNDPKTAHFSYTRYLENCLRNAFDFNGTPISIIYRQRK